MVEHGAASPIVPSTLVHVVERTGELCFKRVLKSRTKTKCRRDRMRVHPCQAARGRGDVAVDEGGGLHERPTWSARSRAAARVRGRSSPASARRQNGRESPASPWLLLATTRCATKSWSKNSCQCSSKARTKNSCENVVVADAREGEPRARKRRGRRAPGERTRLRPGRLLDCVALKGSFACGRRAPGERARRGPGRVLDRSLESKGGGPCWLIFPAVRAPSPAKPPGILIVACAEAPDEGNSTETWPLRWSKPRAPVATGEHGEVGRRLPLEAFSCVPLPRPHLEPR